MKYLHLLVISDVPVFSETAPPYKAFLLGHQIIASVAGPHLYSMLLSNLLVMSRMAFIISARIGFLVHTGHAWDTWSPPPHLVPSGGVVLAAHSTLVLHRLLLRVVVDHKSVILADINYLFTLPQLFNLKQKIKLYDMITLQTYQ